MVVSPLLFASLTMRREDVLNAAPPFGGDESRMRSGVFDSAVGDDAFVVRVLQHGVEYGALKAGLPLPVPLSFALQNPGPAEVFDRVASFSSKDEADRLLNDPQYTGAANSDYTSLPTAAVDGGLAGIVDSPANDGLSEYRFNWVSGTSEVDVNVVGASLTVSEAQAVAKLALPN